MTLRQVIIRDLFGRIVFNQVFPNIAIAISAVSLFITMWGGPIGNFIFIRPKGGKKFIKTTFRLYMTEEGLLLKSNTGESIPIPEPNLEDLPDIEEEDQD